MEEKVKYIYEKFNERRKQTEAKEADLEDLTLLESKIKKNKNQ